LLSALVQRPARSLPASSLAELYAQRPDYINSLADFVCGRPAQPVDAFMRQSNAAIAHDADARLGKIRVPTQITFGRHDMVTSTRSLPMFGDRFTA
jgi:pimeloyl-ACP methyl ester carboxylesterase